MVLICLVLVMSWMLICRLGWLCEWKLWVLGIECSRLLLFWCLVIVMCLLLMEGVKLLLVVGIYWLVLVFGVWLCVVVVCMCSGLV